MRALRISLQLNPPGADPTAGDFSVALDGEVRLPKDRIAAWLDEHREGPLCKCGCGRHVEVTRRHYWLGIPEYRADCRHFCGNQRRAALAKGYYTGAQVAKLFGIGRTTVNRWIKSGKLPKPAETRAGMLLFNIREIDQIRAAQGTADLPTHRSCDFRLHVS
jgi:predicted DNA-binding transcriptional regulator AlpA